MIEVLINPRNYLLLIGLLAGIGFTYKWFDRKERSAEQKVREESKEEVKVSYLLNGLEEDVAEIKEKTQKIPVMSEKIENLNHCTNRQHDKIEFLTTQVEENKEVATKTSTKLDALIKSLNGFNKNG